MVYICKTLLILTMKDGLLFHKTKVNDTFGNIYIFLMRHLSPHRLSLKQNFLTKY